MDEEDIVPDFPDEDLNEDHVPPMTHDDEVHEPFFVISLVICRQGGSQSEESRRDGSLCVGET